MAQNINYGSLAGSSSGVTVNLFSKPDCQGILLTNIIAPYGEDVTVWDSYKPASFLSFDISRALEDQEQLDINKMGQNSGQAQVWSCGNYIMSYYGGTAEGCYNNPNKGTASCIRLWHY